MISRRKIYQLFFLLPFFIQDCKSDPVFTDAFHFIQMDAATTHISFNNQITESDSINVFMNEYMYNGSGVGVGDFNNDGLEDLFFSGSMVSSKLYLNKGNFEFEDITDKAGLQTKNWCTGVSIADINSDGFDDIYVCSSHSADPEKRKNLLFINDGKLHFTEEAAAYGLADTGYATQAAFFDYDKDGDLDMYLLNHRLYSHTANNLQLKDTSGNAPAADRLYRNNGVLQGLTHPVFENVSNQAGIKEDGYGLGVVITDVNDDNWPDVYVAIDYIGNDLLWLNNKNGSFSNAIETSLRHQSYNSMGVDAADINNDLLPDLATLDMQPEMNERKKMMASATNLEKFDMQQRFGYQPSFVRNMLQLNNGTRKINNRNEPFYSEIGQLAGIAETDWSWSVLMADFDNDGWKDMHITNGLAKDVTNNDYTTFRNTQTNSSSYTFSGNNVDKPLDKENIEALRKAIDDYGSVAIDNYLFRNNGDLTFSNITRPSGLASASISNGAAYADLDNDGDLDLVVNNMNQEAFVWKNEIRKSVKDSGENFITVKLKGSPDNTFGIGSRVTLFNKTNKQFLEQSPVRGFSSSVDKRLHFGIGNSTVIDSIKIQWPDDKVQVVQNVKANEVITLQYAGAKLPAADNSHIAVNALFADVTDEYNVNYKHTESQYYDYGAQRGLMQKYSQLGPCIATGDMNGDGLEDFFVGGAAYQSGKLFFQNSHGTFSSKELVQGLKTEEDVAVILFDSDGDKDLDLLITGGSTEFGKSSAANAPRLYNNDGKGNFTLNKHALPQGLSFIAKAVAAADYDADGDIDLFIGSYIEPEKYPSFPQSYFLQNNNGVFTDITKQLCPALQKPGMITGALFTDFNNDKTLDLIICGEWMPVRFFENKNGKFTELTAETGIGENNGMWRCLQAIDIDSDGDMDYIAGNMGLNNKYHANTERPVMLYAKDLDKNGVTDLVPAYYIKNMTGDYKLFPGIDRTQLADEVPSVKKKYLLHKEFSTIKMEKLESDYGKEGWTALKCTTTESIWIENIGNGKFINHPLPIEAQFAPINTMLSCDVNDDGNKDIIIAGNEYETEAMTGRYDASYGLVLLGNGKGKFSPVSFAKTGFILDGNVKDLRFVNIQEKEQFVIAASNNSNLKCLRLSKKNGKS